MTESEPPKRFTVDSRLLKDWLPQQLTIVQFSDGNYAVQINPEDYLKIEQALREARREAQAWKMRFGYLIAFLIIFLIGAGIGRVLTFLIG